MDRIGVDKSIARSGSRLKTGKAAFAITNGASFLPFTSLLRRRARSHRALMRLQMRPGPSGRNSSISPDS